MSSKKSRQNKDIEQRTLELVENADVRKAFFHHFFSVLGPEGTQAWLQVLDSQNEGYKPEEVSIASAMGARQVKETELLALEYANLTKFFQQRQNLLSTAIPATKLANILGVSRTTIHDRFKSGQLLGVLDNNILKFPDWQFDANGPNGLVSGLPEVLAVLKCENFSKVSWLATSNPVFGNDRPIDALRRGEITLVLEEAQSVGIA